MDDTIVGISTALGIGAISIIRVSGSEAISKTNKIFKEKNLEKVLSHTIHYGHIIDNNEIIDEVLISIMKSPKTYTKEDIVEINCHGGISTTNKVLELLIRNNCRLANPGEFTKRAFLNGRIDLIEADGIMNLIESKTEKSRKLSINQLRGSVSKCIKELRSEIINIISNIEVNIDYPEYNDIEVLTNDKIKPMIINIKEELEKIIKKSEYGPVINNGIKVGIIGRPNVGKSSLLNALLEEEKAIVTDVAGTTRDIVEGNLQIDGIALNIIDTAGIRITDDVVEKIGVEKSKKIIEESELILLLLNNNELLTDIDKELINNIKTKKSIIVINKVDLEKNLEPIEFNNIVYISAKDNIGIDNLKNKIRELFNLVELENDDMNYVTSSYGIGLLKRALDEINITLKSINDNEPVDIVEINLRNSWNTLGSIIGETYSDELIDEMFSRFCLGK